MKTVKKKQHQRFSEIDKFMKHIEGFEVFELYLVLHWLVTKTPLGSHQSYLEQTILSSFETESWPFFSLIELELEAAKEIIERQNRWKEKNLTLITVSLGITDARSIYGDLYPNERMVIERQELLSCIEDGLLIWTELLWHVNRARTLNEFRGNTLPLLLNVSPYAQIVKQYFTNLKFVCKQAPALYKLFRDDQVFDVPRHLIVCLERYCTDADKLSKRFLFDEQGNPRKNEEVMGEIIKLPRDFFYIACMSLWLKCSFLTDVKILTRSPNYAVQAAYNRHLQNRKPCIYTGANDEFIVGNIRFKYLRVSDITGHDTGLPRKKESSHYLNLLYQEQQRFLKNQDKEDEALNDKNAQEEPLLAENAFLDILDAAYAKQIEESVITSSEFVASKKQIDGNVQIYRIQSAALGGRKDIQIYGFNFWLYFNTVLGLSPWDALAVFLEPFMGAHKYVSGTEILSVAFDLRQRLHKWQGQIVVGLLGKSKLLAEKERPQLDVEYAAGCVREGVILWVRLSWFIKRGLALNQISHSNTTALLKLLPQRQLLEEYAHLSLETFKLLEDNEKKVKIWDDDPNFYVELWDTIHATKEETGFCSRRTGAVKSKAEIIELLDNKFKNKGNLLVESYLQEINDHSFISTLIQRTKDTDDWYNSGDSVESLECVFGGFRAVEVREGLEVEAEKTLKKVNAWDPLRHFRGFIKQKTGPAMLQTINKKLYELKLIESSNDPEFRLMLYRQLYYRLEKIWQRDKRGYRPPIKFEEFMPVGEEMWRGVSIDTIFHRIKDPAPVPPPKLPPIEVFEWYALSNKREFARSPAYFTPPIDIPLSPSEIIDILKEYQKIKERRAVNNYKPTHYEKWQRYGTPKEVIERFGEGSDSEDDETKPI